MTAALTEPLTASPIRSLLRHRLSSRVDRALVFLSPEGEDDRVAHPRGAGACFHRPPSLSMVWRKVFDRVCWVSLVEYDATVNVAARTAGPVQPTAGRPVTWRVFDPVTAARRRLPAQDVPSWIAYDMERRAVDSGRGEEHAPGTQESAVDPVEARDMEWPVPEVGIAYRLLPQSAPPLPESSTGPAVPPQWTDEQNAAYRFYRGVVAQGPHDLAALWLLHHPDQARDVLEWTVENRNLLSEKAAWEQSLVALLQGLDTADRCFVGVKVAEVLRGLGIPHAGEALDRVRDAQSSGSPNSPNGNGAWRQHA
jgi:hypothetical protein